MTKVTKKLALFSLAVAIVFSFMPFLSGASGIANAEEKMVLNVNGVDALQQSVIPCVQGGITYDAKTNTLTMDNAIISKGIQGYAGLEYSGSDTLTIKLIGDCGILGTSENEDPTLSNPLMVGIDKSGSGNIRFVGEGNLTIAGDSMKHFFAISGGNCVVDNTTILIMNVAESGTPVVFNKKATGRIILKNSASLMIMNMTSKGKAMSGDIDIQSGSCFGMYNASGENLFAGLKLHFENMPVVSYSSSESLFNANNVVLGSVLPLGYEDIRFITYYDRNQKISNLKDIYYQEYGDTLTLEPRAGNTLTFTSDNTAVATVDDWDYTVQMKKVGTANITIKEYIGAYYAGKRIITIVVNPAKANIKKISVGAKGSKSIQVIMKKDASKLGAQKYQIQYRVKGNKAWNSVKTKNRKETLTKLKKGKTYEIRVRSLANVGGKTYKGAWSNTVVSTVVK